MTHETSQWPKKSDRICVVGAGAGGLHLSYLLSAMGYENIVVLEKSARIGGKSYTYTDDDGVDHEHGTCYSSNDYVEVKEWLARYQLDDYVPALQEGHQGQQVWEHINQNPTTFREYAIQTARKAGAGGFLGFLDFVVGLSVIRGLKKYIRLHKEILGTYEGQLPPQPSKEVLRELRRPFSEWLKKHDLEHLIPVFFLTHTTQGYGPLEDIPVFYAFVWNTPRMIEGYINTLRGRDDSGFEIVLSGWQRLWERMADEGRFELRLNADVTAVKRTESAVEVTIDGADTPEIFDYIVLACPLKNFLAALDASDKEREILGALSCYHFSTTVFRSVQGHVSQFLFDRWFDNVDAAKPFAVVAQRLTAQADHPEIGNNDPDAVEARVAYQFSTRHIPIEEQDRKFEEHYEQFDARDVEILNRYRTEYFWRFDADGLEAGYPWQLQALQGHNRTLYTGGSCCFESVNDIVSYNRWLLRQMGLDAPQVKDLPPWQPKADKG